MNFVEYYNNGIDLWNDGKFTQAIQSFREALKLQPNDANLRQMVEQFEIRAAQMAEFEQKAREAATDEAESRRNVMGGLYGITDEHRVVAEYPQKLLNNPNDKDIKGCLALAHYIMGLMFISKGDNESAVKELSRAIHYQPDYPLAIYKRASLKLELRQFDLAIEDLEMLLPIDPNPEKVKNALAHTYFERARDRNRKGEIKLAIDDLEKGLKFNPDNNHARDFLKTIKEKQNG